VTGAPEDSWVSTKARLRSAIALYEGGAGSEDVESKEMEGAMLEKVGEGKAGVGLVFVVDDRKIDY